MATPDGPGIWNDILAGAGLLAVCAALLWFGQRSAQDDRGHALLPMEACRRDLSCIGERGVALAEQLCEASLARHAAGRDRSAFTHYQWSTSVPGAVTYRGRQSTVAGQAPFGYECDVDVQNRQLLAFRMRRADGQSAAAPSDDVSVRLRCDTADAGCN